jgi:hypothetical protein
MGPMVQTFLSGGSITFNINDAVGYFFQTKKGLLQGDPLSHLLFNIVANMLAILIKRANEEGQISGVVPHLVDGGLSVLQYADDTILFMEHTLNHAQNLKLLLMLLSRHLVLK